MAALVAEQAAATTRLAEDLKETLRDVAVLRRERQRMANRGGANGGGVPRGGYHRGGGYY